ncbi:BRO-N domain-containing protein [Acinetobacter guillouiae]|uniref:Bro-N domain-containing protein n=1 Tax=Acinetobacter guillouiae NIPH 991 TaxID=1217656 RepID=N8YHH5_ACIGI|nr:BRO family protein [Acinetobacter guillouiae]ENV18730.1 hypothetical protein F964_00530 [Acinetobacter guillouiae NIPH 991]
MNSLTLSFNEVNFSPVQHDKQIWLTASELAKALGYAKSDAVAQIYERNKDEFNDSMTTTLKLSVVRKTGSVEMDNRIFSLRGCHLVTFFARTKVAKQFRKWVLDVLDKEVGNPIAKTHKEEREPLTNAVNLLVAKTKHLNYSDAYKLVHQRFNVKHIDEIPYDEIPIAVEYVHHLIALYSQTEKQGSLFDKDDYELVHQMTEAILAQNGAMDNVWKALELIDPLFINNYASYILKSNSLARKVSADFDFRTKRGQPLVDSFCRTINLSSGHRIGVNPKWFNAPAW